jgi:hypothetical protein
MVYDIILKVPNSESTVSFTGEGGRGCSFKLQVPLAYGVYLRNKNAWYDVAVEGFVYWNHDSPVTTTNKPTISPMLQPTTSLAPFTTTTKEPYTMPPKDNDNTLAIAVPCGIIGVVIICVVGVIAVVLVRRIGRGYETMA